MFAVICIHTKWCVCTNVPIIHTHTQLYVCTHMQKEEGREKRGEQNDKAIEAKF